MHARLLRDRPLRDAHRPRRPRCEGAVVTLSDACKTVRDRQMLVALLERFAPPLPDPGACVAVVLDELYECRSGERALTLWHPTLDDLASDGWRITSPPTP